MNRPDKTDYLLFGFIATVAAWYMSRPILLSLGDDAFRAWIALSLLIVPLSLAFWFRAASIWDRAEQEHIASLKQNDHEH